MKERNKLKIITAENYMHLSELVAQIIIKKVHEKPNAVIGLATGSTPIGMYQQLIKDYLKNGTSYEHIKTVNLDEYVGLSENHPQSYRYYMDYQLFKHINIKNENIFIPNGKNSLEACESYEKNIQHIGGVDLQILGIGHNGHIGFNEPNTPFSSRTHIVELADSTRQANARFFEGIEEVPKHAITMGIETILQSKQIILLASGISKSDAVNRLFSKEINENFPASALHHHSDVTVVVDKEAANYSPLSYE